MEAGRLGGTEGADEPWPVVLWSSGGTARHELTTTCGGGTVEAGQLAGWEGAAGRRAVA